MPEIRYKTGTHFSRVHYCRPILATTGTWRRILVDIQISEFIRIVSPFLEWLADGQVVETAVSCFCNFSLRRSGKSRSPAGRGWHIMYTNFPTQKIRKCLIWQAVCQNAYGTAGCDQAIDCATTAICVSTGGVLLLCDVSMLCCMLIEYIYQPELPLLADPQGQSALWWHIPIQITVLLIMFYCSNKRDLNAAVNQQDTVTVASISTHSSCPRLPYFNTTPWLRPYAHSYPGSMWRWSSICPGAAGSHVAVRVSWPVWTSCIKITEFYLRSVFRCLAICTARQICRVII